MTRPGPEQALETTRPGVVEGVDVDAVAAAALACPGVAGPSAGRFGEVVSYLPGRQVPGVRVAPGEVTVGVTARWGQDAHSLWRQLNAVTAGLLAGRRLHVVIADIDLPPDPGVEHVVPAESLLGVAGQRMESDVAGRGGARPGESGI